MQYPPPSEVSHFLRTELKNAQMALKEAHLQYEKNKEEHDALFKAWIDRKTQKRRVFPPEKTQRFEDEANRIRNAAPVLREAISTAEKHIKRVKQKIRNELFYDRMHDDRIALIEYGPRPPTATPLPNRYWFQTTSDEERNRPPPHHTSSDSYDDLFTTTCRERKLYKK
jgi:hypothetical protein